MYKASLVAQIVKNLPVMQETWVQYLGQDEPLKKGKGRSPREGNGNPLQYLAWRIPRTEGPGVLQSMGSQRVEHH